MATEMIAYRNGIELHLGEREPSIGRAARTGAMVILLAFGGALSWGFLASLDSAARAPGTVVVEGNRKTVQHLEGGIVAELSVRNGDRVEAGQVLLRLEGTQSRANLEELAAEQATALVRLARLRAEYAGERGFSVPEDLAGPATARFVEVQRRLFAARWMTFDGEIAVLREQRLQAEREINAHLAQERAATEQIAYTREELAGVQELVDKGLERKLRLLSLKRYLAEVTGNRDQGRARVAQAEQAMAVADFQIRSREKKRQAEIAAELEEAQGALEQAMARIKAARDAVTRTEIRAPVGGRVVSLAVFTQGAVIKPGEPILEIVPADDTLTIEARLDPTDIDVVHSGQKAQVHLTAYKQRRTPTIDATVVDVSADRLTDPKTGAAYFAARVRPDPAALKRLGDVELHPGMPTDVLIATGKRRAIDYFVAPLQDAMARALIED